MSMLIEEGKITILIDGGGGGILLHQATKLGMCVIVSHLTSTSKAWNMSTLIEEGKITMLIEGAGVGVGVILLHQATNLLCVCVS